MPPGRRKVPRDYPPQGRRIVLAMFQKHAVRCATMATAWRMGVVEKRIPPCFLKNGKTAIQCESSLP
jgi:hypothetical protein